jgi:hypothetical protein
VKSLVVGVAGGNRRLRLSEGVAGSSKAPSLPTTGSGDMACPPADRSFLIHPFTPAKEKKMIRLVVFVAGVVVGAIGTVVVQNPQKVVTKVREAAAFVMKKACEVYQAGEPEGEKPADGPGDRAA